MKLLEILYFTISALGAMSYNTKKDIPGTIFCCANMIVAAIYIANA